MKGQANKYTAFPHLGHHHMQILLKCFSACSACSKMCIEEGMKETAKLCSDCADVCGLTIKLHSGDSEFSHQAFKFCAEVCERCAEECAQMDSDHCQQCSQICQECAEACTIEA